MPYLKTRQILAIIMCAALWAVLNNTLAPIFWQLTHTPFICDFLAFVSLILVVWWVRRLGAASITGLLVAALTIAFRPDAVHMLGFTVASVVFDVLTRIIGYKNSFDKPLPSTVSLVLLSTLCAAIAGLIIGSLFMKLPTVLAIIVFGGMHTIGGFVGGIIGVMVIRALTARKITPSREQP